MMVNKKSLVKFLGVLLIVGLLFTATPETSNAQDLETGCCQFQSNITGKFICEESFGRCRVHAETSFIGFFEGSTCDEQTGVCSGFLSKDIPTLSEWGLIAMAGVLGVVGFIVIRRKRVTA